jgi:hypothetical protein
MTAPRASRFTAVRRAAASLGPVDYAATLLLLGVYAVGTSLDEGSKDVGTAAAFEGRLDGKELELEPADHGYRDRETGSTFDITGRATDGPLAGERLPQVRHDQQFWFALAAFVPDARILE